MNICINKFSNVSSPQFDRLLTDLVFGAKIYISVWAANEMGLGLVNKVTYYLLRAVRQVGQLLCVGNSAFGRFASIQALSLERRFSWATRGGGNRGTGRGVVGREVTRTWFPARKKSQQLQQFRLYFTSSSDKLLRSVINLFKLGRALSWTQSVFV